MEENNNQAPKIEDRVQPPKAIGKKENFPLLLIIVGILALIIIFMGIRPYFPKKIQNQASTKNYNLTPPASPTQQ